MSLWHMHSHLDLWRFMGNLVRALCSRKKKLVKVLRLDLPEFKSYNRKHWRRERQNSGTWQLAWRKNRLIRDELIMHQSWTGLDKGLQSSDLWRMDSVQQMASFVQLWDLVQQVVLSDEQDQTA